MNGHKLLFFQVFMTQIRNTCYLFVPGIGAFLSNMCQFTNLEKLIFSGKRHNGMKAIHYTKNLVHYAMMIVVALCLFHEWSWWYVGVFGFIALILNIWDAWREALEFIVPEDQAVELHDMLFRCRKKTEAHTEKDDSNATHKPVLEIATE